MTTDARFEAMQKEINAMRLRIRILIGTVGLAVLLALGTAANVDPSAMVQDEIKARRFVLVDAQGKPRAELAVDDDGSSGLTFRDTRGNMRAGLSVGPQGSVLGLSDAQGQPRIDLAVGPYGFPLLDMNDDQGNIRVELMVTGSPTLDMSDDQGKNIWSAPPSSNVPKSTL